MAAKIQNGGQISIFWYIIVQKSYLIWSIMSESM